MAIVMNVRKKLNRIAVVELHGTIGGSVKSSTYEKIFSDIEKDPRARAMVLDIDSPGGAVPASDYLYRSVLKVADRKPVVASVRGVNASGAYLISCAAHRIVAIPGAIVGSIGVLSVRPNVQQLLERVGVGVNVNKSGAFKDMGAPWREQTPEEREKLQELVDSFYDGFVSIVAKSRKMDEAAVRNIATGEVFWASKARELGLVDELGDLDRAIDIAVEMSGAPRNPVHVRPRRGLRDLLMRPMAASLVDSVSEELDKRLWMGLLR